MEEVQSPVDVGLDRESFERFSLLPILWPVL